MTRGRNLLRPKSNSSKKRSNFDQQQTLLEESSVWAIYCYLLQNRRVLHPHGVLTFYFLPVMMKKNPSSRKARPPKIDYLTVTTSPQKYFLSPSSVAVAQPSGSLLRGSSWRAEFLWSTVGQTHKKQEAVFSSSMTSDDDDLLLLLLLHRYVGIRQQIQGKTAGAQGILCKQTTFVDRAHLEDGTRG